MPVKTKSGTSTEPWYIKTFTMDSLDLNILIWTRTKAEAEDIDQVVKELLVEYGYDPEAPKARKTFEGTYFVHYHFSKKSNDIEEDVEFVLTNQPQDEKPQEKQLPPKKSELLEKLKKVLETTQGILIVGGLLFATVAAAHESYKNYVEAAGVKPPVAVTAPAAPAAITKIPLPPTVVPLIETADKDPKKFETVMNFIIVNHIVHEEHSRRWHRHSAKHPKHPKHKKQKPESPPSGRGPLGTQ